MFNTSLIFAAITGLTLLTVGPLLIYAKSLSYRMLVELRLRDITRRYYHG